MGMSGWSKGSLNLENKEVCQLLSSLDQPLNERIFKELSPKTFSRSKSSSSTAGVVVV